MLLWKRRSTVQSVPLNRILLGGENDLPGYRYSLLTGDFKRPSCSVASGPHAEFLSSYLKLGDAILETPFFERPLIFTMRANALSFLETIFQASTLRRK